MIVLDAGVLIAARNPDDAHHHAATRFLSANVAEALASNTVTIAESLVRAIVADRAEDVLGDYEIMGLIALDLPGESAGVIARVRAESRLRMPDALVLYSAERHRAEVATTDAAVARVAGERGLTVHLVAD